MWRGLAGLEPDDPVCVETQELVGMIGRARDTAALSSSSGSVAKHRLWSGR